MVDFLSLENRLLTTKETAKMLGMSVAFLERDRWAGACIPFVKVGTRSVRYQLSAIEAYINFKIRKSTTDKGDN